MMPRKAIEAAMWCADSYCDAAYRAIISNQTLILEVLLDIRDALTTEDPDA